jgi:hypothetical protein
MIHKSRMSSLLAVTALGISTAESAMAMPADYCAANATSAVQEFNHATHDPACPAVSGGRWARGLVPALQVAPAKFNRRRDSGMGGAASFSA